MSECRDTIYALSSGHGRAGVAVVRIPGPAAGGGADVMGQRSADRVGVKPGWTLTKGWLSLHGFRPGPARALSGTRGAG
jgi:hypothetical protein